MENKWGPISSFEHVPVLINLMGHDRMAGWLTFEKEPGVYRVETPETDVAAATYFLSLGAVFQIVPTDETTMLKAAKHVNTFAFSRHGWENADENLFIPDRVSLPGGDDGLPF